MDQSGSQPSTTYQLTTLTPGLADAVIKDDSPTILQGEIWQFLNVDISTANLTEVDILNIMDMVDIAFCNLINGLSEDLWHEFRIKETTWAKDQKTGKVVTIDEKIYPITELWDAVRAKVYIKCCKARGGFLMRVLTENRSSISQRYEEAGVMRMPGYPAPAQSQDKKGSWGAI